MGLEIAMLLLNTGDTFNWNGEGEALRFEYVYLRFVGNTIDLIASVTQAGLHKCLQNNI